MKYLLVISNLLLFFTVAGQKTEFPSIGAQVFIEPGQTREQIENWFRLLNEHQFTSCRIRLFEAYMRNGNGEDDFRLFDWAFEAAEKYDIAIFATLFPDVPFENVGGVKLPDDEEHLKRIASYISKTVQRFEGHNALAAWVLINEPGLGYLPQSDFVKSKMDQWKDTLAKADNSLSLYREVDFEKNRFLIELNTWFLNWLADQIRRHDDQTPLHVNNHQVFSLADEYDFPSWMSFLSSLGASIHPSWHFRYFEKEDYPLAVSANLDLIASSTEGKPFWVTELQGGSNVFSGYSPITPSKSDIEKWLWLSIASGTEGIIFWSLNARSVGIEAGEWALLDYTGQPSDRLEIAGEIATRVASDSFFKSAKPLKAGVRIVYTHESLWAEKYLHVGPSQIEARNWGASMKSALGFYKSLTQMGIPANLGEIGTIDWKDPEQVLILPNQLAVADADWTLLQTYVRAGGKLILSGLSGQFTETLFNRWMDKDQYESFLGAEIKDHALQSRQFTISINSYPVRAHYLKGMLADDKAFHEQPYGEGWVVWVPSMVGLGAWLYGSESLASWLLTHSPEPPHHHHDRVVTRWMENNDYLLGVFVNSGQDQGIYLSPEGKPEVVFGSPEIIEKQLYIRTNQTIVLKWEKD